MCVRLCAACCTRVADASLRPRLLSAQFGVFPADADAAAVKAFGEVAQSQRDDFVFATVTDASILPSGGAGGVAGPQVVLLKKFDEGRAATAEALDDATALGAWVTAHASPRVARLDKDPKNRAALQRVFGAPFPKVLAFASLSTDAGKALEASLGAAAVAHPELRFIIGDAEDNDGALNFFGLTAADLPAAVVHDTTAGDKKYAVPHVDPATGVEALIAGFQSGSLAPTVKSEAVPESNDGPVTVLVAKNFDAIVNVPGKTVLLEFYAPWCGHCKTLAPIYDKLGAALKGRADVVIAKMDATANDVTDARFSVQGFPTLYLKTAGGEIVPYSGERTLEALKAFVEEHADAAPAAAVAGGDAAAAAAELKDEL